MHPLFRTLKTTIFSEMSALAQKHGAINLGQGFPEEDGAPELREAAARALLERSNQYAPTLGLAELRSAVAEHYARETSVTLSAETEVLITSGATEALAAALLALVNPGTEVVCFEPLYDAYLPLIERAGGIPRLGRLPAPSFRLTAELLERTLTEKPKIVLLNTPNNPGGSLIEPSELEPLIRHVERYGTRIISDEVWEHVTFGEAKHTSLLAVPGLRESVVKIGSAGKMFALTGWKVGFICAAPELTRVISRAHQFLTFSTPPALQIAVAAGLQFPSSYFETQSRNFERSRLFLAERLREEGFILLPGDGTYFLNLDLEASGLSLSDIDFANFAVTKARVASIPLSAFYRADAPKNFVRLCFAKKDETLEEGARRLGDARRLAARSPL